MCLTCMQTLESPLDFSCAWASEKGLTKEQCPYKKQDQDRWSWVKCAACQAKEKAAEEERKKKAET